MNHGKMVNRAREVLAAAGTEGAAIRETTPQMGGLRERPVEWLIGNGEAEWIVPGQRARLVQKPTEVLTDRGP